MFCLFLRQNILPLQWLFGLESNTFVFWNLKFNNSKSLMLIFSPWMWAEICVYLNLNELHAPSESVHVWQKLQTILKPFRLCFSFYVLELSPAELWEIMWHCHGVQVYKATPLSLKTHDQIRIFCTRRRNGKQTRTDWTLRVRRFVCRRRSLRRASPSCHFRLTQATLCLTNNDTPAQHRSCLVSVSHHHRALSDMPAPPTPHCTCMQARRDSESLLLLRGARVLLLRQLTSNWTKPEVCRYPEKKTMSTVKLWAGTRVPYAALIPSTESILSSSAQVRKLKQQLVNGGAYCSCSQLLQWGFSWKPDYCCNTRLCGWEWRVH